MKKIINLLILLPLFAHAQMISTVAGNGTWSYSGDGGAATAATFKNPTGVALDAFGNIYIVDEINSRVRKVNTSGIISTIAGIGVYGYSGDGGAATAAELSFAWGITLDSLGNIYIADCSNHCIRKVDTSGIISTIAGTGVGGFSGDGGQATAAKLNYPRNIIVDGYGVLYFSDESNNRVRKINTSGIITTIAGNGLMGSSGDGGVATAAELYYPFGLALDRLHNIYIADQYNNRIRKVDTSGIITTFAGNGTWGYSGDGGSATVAEIKEPTGVTSDAFGNIFISDAYNYVIRKVNTSGIITTVVGNGTGGYAGDGGEATAAELNQPSYVAFDAAQNMYIADIENNRIRLVGSENHIPHFAGGHFQFLNMCDTAGAYYIDSLIAIIDSDMGQTETLSLVLGAIHGVAITSYSTPSSGGLIMPVGLTYTPTSGYIGNDTFIVRVTDGVASDTTSIYVTVLNCTLDISTISKMYQEQNRIYPNPTSSTTIISCNDNIASIAISNLMGQTVYYNEYNSNQVEISVADLPAGVYLIKINGREIRKLFKQ